MDKNYNEETFCVAPWVSAHLSTFGKVIPCCLYKQERVFGELKSESSIEESYNSDTAKEIRRQLWNGEKINECQICWYREEVSKVYYHRIPTLIENEVGELTEIIEEKERQLFIHLKKIIDG